MVGELTPIRRRRFVPRARVSEVFSRAAPVDRDRFVADVDEWVDLGAAPRG